MWRLNKENAAQTQEGFKNTHSHIDILATGREEERGEIMRRFAQGNWWQIAFWLEEYFFTAEMNLIVFNSSANAN